MKNLILVIFISILAQSISNACTCWNFVPYFCHAVDESTNVVTAVITEFPIDIDYPFDIPRLMTVELLENIRFEVPDSVFQIYGHDGLNCGMDLIWEVGDSLVLAIDYRYELNGIPTYDLTNCNGPHALKLENNFAVGSYDVGTQSLSLDELTFNLLNNTPCSSINISTHFSEEQINIYPNPTSVTCNLLVENIEVNSIIIRLFDINGAEMNISHSTFNDNIQFNVADIPSGIYLVHIEQGDKIVRKKLIIQ